MWRHGRRCSPCCRVESSRERNSPSGVEPPKTREESMRIAFAIPLLLLGACNVSKDSNSVTVQYDQNTAENTAADIGNTAQNIATDIGNDVQKTGDKLENKIGNADDNMKVDMDEHTYGPNKTTTTSTTA